MRALRFDDGAVKDAGPDLRDMLQRVSVTCVMNVCWRSRASGAAAIRIASSCSVVRLGTAVSLDAWEALALCKLRRY